MSLLARVTVGSVGLVGALALAGPATALNCDVYSRNCATPTPTPTSSSGVLPTQGAVPTPTATSSSTPPATEEPITGGTPIASPAPTAVDTQTPEPPLPGSSSTPTPDLPVQGGTPTAAPPVADSGDDDDLFASTTSLPLTGGQLVLALLTGTGLAGAGTALVVSARRKSQDAA